MNVDKVLRKNLPKGDEKNESKRKATFHNDKRYQS